MKKVKIELSDEPISLWESINISDPKQRDAYDKLVRSIAEFQKEIIIARHSSESIEDINFEGGYKKSIFSSETDGYDIQDKVALVAIEIFKENHGLKKTISPFEIRERYLREYGKELDSATCRKGLLRRGRFFAHNKEKSRGRHSTYVYNFGLDSVNAVSSEIKGEANVF